MTTPTVSEEPITANVYDFTAQCHIAALATEMGGSFAAEHGLGRAKIALAERNRGAVELELMARLKGAFDPLGTMNPGVLLRTAE